MRYLIDTYNVLHAAAALGGPLAGMTVRRLCQYLAASGAATKATLVLDGRAKPDEPSVHEFPDLTLVYSGAGVPADAVIGQMVERSRERKKITVVTNDRAVALQARQHFAQAMSCEQFLRQVTERMVLPREEPLHKATGTPTAGEAEHWMREFGLEGDPNPGARGGKEREEGLGEIDIEDLLGPRGG